MSLYNLIVAIDNKSGISKNNIIPWYIPQDLKYFKKKTEYSYVVMGKNTWLSLKKPLENRINVVISTTLKKSDSNPPHHIFNSFENFLSFIKLKKVQKDYSPLYNTTTLSDDIYIIGGSRLYKESMMYSNCIYIYTTEIYKNFECDNFFPTIPNHFKTVNVGKFNYDKNTDTYFRHITYKKIDLYSRLWKNLEEENYLNLLRDILNNGIQKNDRTNIGTISLFGHSLSYDISDTFPILTTRKQFFRGIFEELMFYLRGQTDNNILVNKGIHIWTKNTTREFLDNKNLNNHKEGDMGSTYGFNFRHFGFDYYGCDYNYVNGNGFDQLSHIINLIKNEPDSRRIIISLWDPNNNKNAALPSCLCWYQFYVRKNFLDLIIHIRSSDYFLANNWNTCTGALFVNLICNLKDINLVPGRLIVNMGDVHIYKNHIEEVKNSLERTPKPFPKLNIVNKKDNITDFNFEDVKLIGYSPQNSIKVDMAV